MALHVPERSACGSSFNRRYFAPARSLVERVEQVAARVANDISVLAPRRMKLKVVASDFAARAFSYRPGAHFRKALSRCGRTTQIGSVPCCGRFHPTRPDKDAASRQGCPVCPKRWPLFRP